MIIPYLQIDGKYTLSDDAIKKVWESVDARWTFYDKSVVDAEGFVRHMKSPKTFPVIAGDGRPMAVAWLTDIAENHAFAHFCMLNPGKKVYDVANEIIDYWWSFGEGRLFDVLLGLIPAHNKMALKFVQRLGFTLLPPIPAMARDAYINARIPAVVMYLERK